MNSLTRSPTSSHPVRPRTLVVVLALLMLVASACGSSTSNEPQATGATSETSSKISDDGETGDEASGSDARTDDASTPATGGDSDPDVAAQSEPGAEEPSAAATPVSAELAHDCVPPGGTQTITITSEPQVAVGYQTVYSDGNKGGSERPFGSEPSDEETTYGGSGAGLTEASGRWADTWTISTDAPDGPVKTQAFATGYDTDMGATVVTFRVANPIECA